jgi:prepilin-type N-terminal cleavage/methylation domain-containing protein
MFRAAESRNEQTPAGKKTAPAEKMTVKIPSAPADNRRTESFLCQVKTNKGTIITMICLSQRQKPSRRGFTLIELLVVIAIISVLAAILFPAFASAREKARQAACISNEQQMGLAMQQYAQDYNDSIVPYAMENPNGGDDPNTAYERVWSGLLQPYIKNGLNTSTLSNITNPNASGIFACPSFSITQLVSGADAADCDGAGYAENVGVNNPEITFADYGITQPFGPSLGYNPYTPGTLGTPAAPYNNYPGSGINSNGVFVNLTQGQVQRPSQTVFIGDGWTGYPNSSSPYAGQFTSLMGCEGDKMHMGVGENFLFLDGHAKFIQGNILTMTSQNAAVGDYMTYLSYDQ